MRDIADWRDDDPAELIAQDLRDITAALYGRWRRTRRRLHDGDTDDGLWDRATDVDLHDLP